MAGSVRTRGYPRSLDPLRRSTIFCRLAVRASSWIPATVALIALSGFVFLTRSLERLEWTDAYVAAFSDALRGCDGYPVSPSGSPGRPRISPSRCSRPA